MIDSLYRNRVCRECGQEFQYDHRATPFRRYCDEHLTVKCRGENCISRIPRRGGAYCSEECRAPIYKKRVESRQVWLECPCGQQFRKYRNLSRRNYCSDECSKKFDRRGDRLRNNPDLAREIASRPKPNHGLKGYKQTNDHLIKRLGTGAIRASKEELSLVPALQKLGYRHTGEGAFWRRWKDGTLHNPDFVNEETKSVVEYFGSYWHADDRGREDEIKARWAEIGWECIIIWPEDRESWGNQAFGLPR